MSASSPVPNPAMLVLARESRGKRQGQVAQDMSEVLGIAVSQGYVSRAEAGRLNVTEDRLEAMAEVLGYPVALLCSDPAADGVGVGLVHHRKKASLGAPALRQIHSELALCRRQTAALVAAAGGRPHSFFRVDLTETDSPEEKAIELRDRWGVPPGPIDGLVRLIEDAGGIVLVRDLGTSEIDAVSQWPDDGVPLLLLSSRAPGDRFRFSLAHELGHLLLHREPGGTQDQESQADRFASELLMPAEIIRRQLAGADIARVTELKPRWGVSMAALIRRGLDLGALTEWQYRNLMIEMSVMGYRAQEPVAIAPEVPTAIADIVAGLLGRGYTREQLAAMAGLLSAEFEQQYLKQLTSIRELSTQS